jgi:hypothetical protein
MRSRRNELITEVISAEWLGAAGFLWPADGLPGWRAGDPDGPRASALPEKTAGPTIGCHWRSPRLRIAVKVAPQALGRGVTIFLFR